jgi:hypothetical protein
MNFDKNELKKLFQNLLQGRGHFTIITYDPQFGDLERGFTFEAVPTSNHKARVTAWFKQDVNSETKQISTVPGIVLFNYMQLAIASACCIEIYEEGEELSYVYGEQIKH